MNTILKIATIATVSVFLMGAKCKQDEPASNYVTIDPSLKQKCPTLPWFNPESITMGDLMVAYKDLQVQYIECAIRHDCLIEAVDSKVQIKCPTLKRIEEERQDTTGEVAEG